VNPQVEGILKLSNLRENLVIVPFFIQFSNIKFYENSFICFPVFTSVQIDGLDAQNGRQDT
jgi:hypothetical protein